jgi:hypothetical protein
MIYGYTLDLVFGSIQPLTLGHVKLTATMEISVEVPQKKPKLEIELPMILLYHSCACI